MITVIMPVYNGSRFMRQAIESILQQTFTQFEFVIVDDGSTDNSVDIIREYAAEDDRIVFMQIDHGGGCKARNSGLEVARYNWIVCMDADDIALPNRLERLIQAAQDEPDVILWGSYYYQINVDGKRIGTVRIGPTSKAAFFKVQESDEPLIITQPTAMYRRDIALKVGGYDEQLQAAQELELWDRMIQHGPAVVLPEPLLLYRLHGSSISSKKFFEQWLIHTYVKERKLARRKGKELLLKDFKHHYHSQPRLNRLLRYINTRGRFQYRNAGVLLSEGNRLQAIISMGAAAICAPRFVFGRIINRLAPRKRKR